MLITFICLTVMLQKKRRGKREREREREREGEKERERGVLCLFVNMSARRNTNMFRVHKWIKVLEELENHQQS